jgi:hypothetical protein
MTSQQAAALRHNPVARSVRLAFPVGARVEGLAGSGPTGALGTVKRHVVQNNAQGGYLVVKWDNGEVGRHSAISLRVVEGEGAGAEHYVQVFDAVQVENKVADARRLERITDAEAVIAADQAFDADCRR